MQGHLPLYPKQKTWNEILHYMSNVNGFSYGKENYFQCTLNFCLHLKQHILQYNSKTSTTCINSLGLFKLLHLFPPLNHPFRYELVILTIQIKIKEIARIIIMTKPKWKSVPKLWSTIPDCSPIDTSKLYNETTSLSIANSTQTVK